MTHGSEATKVLREEHVWILEVSGVLERVLEAEAETGALDVQAAEDCLSFIRLFADACHHGKEEDLLFTEMEHAGMNRDGGPIAVMLHEHQQGRAFVAAMLEALADHRGGSAEGVRDFVRGAYGYIELMRQHILKENHVLFEMADQLLVGPSCERLCEAYDGVCARNFEGCTKSDLEALATSLQERYPALSD